MSDDVAMMMEREAGLPESVPAVLVGFTLHAEAAADESEKQGRPVYHDREYVKIIIPGDKQTVVFQRAEDSHKKRFPRAYEQFLKREAEPIKGTPIGEWPVITRSQAAMLKAVNIPTVEALVEVADSNIGNLGPGGYELRAKAKAWLAQAKDSAAAQAIAAENERLKNQIADLQRQVNDLAARLQAPVGEGAEAEIHEIQQSPATVQNSAEPKRRPKRARPES